MLVKQSRTLIKVKTIIATACVSILSAAVSSTSVAFANCCDASREAFVQSRIDSADELLADGARIEKQTRNLIEAVNKISAADRDSSPFPSQRIASSAVTEDVYSLYENLFRQYEEALAAYKRHREAYNQHALQYHNQPQPDMISPSELYQAKTPAAGGLQALRFRAQDKCAQLQQLENTIIANEQQLQQMLSDLAISQQKESAALFASAWADANQLAMQNSNLAAQFNHMGLQKTAQVANSVHDLIELANRDGAYSAHIEAYKNLSDSNNVEQQIVKRSNYHGQVAMQTLSRLAAMRPAGQMPGVPSSEQRSYSAADLEQENNALDSEYARVQDLFQKLESVRKSMPPNFSPKQGILK